MKHGSTLAWLGFGLARLGFGGGRGGLEGTQPFHFAKSLKSLFVGLPSLVIAGRLGAGGP